MVEISPVQSYVDFNFWLVVHFDNVKTSLAAKILGRGRANLPVVSNFYSPVDLQRRITKKSDIAVAVFPISDLRNRRYRASAPSLRKFSKYCRLCNGLMVKISP